MIRAILFDLDDTLIDRATAHRRYCADFAARFCHAVPPEFDRESLASMRRWSESSTFHRRLFLRLLEKRLPGVRLSLAALDADCKAHLPRFIEPEPAVLQLLGRLANRYRLAVVSNGSGRMQRAKLAQAGLSHFISGTWISGERRTRKPDPALFRLALADLDVRPEDALMVGNDPVEDIFGAQNAGLRTCWITPDRDQRWQGAGPAPDLIIDHVARLAEVLE